mgnify:CR=1 FL=1
MLPVVALVGRPNVGKSTLFNRLTRSRDALVADYPGLTRDRQYGQAEVEEHPFIVIDTGGIHGDEEGIDALMAEQSLMAVEEADAVLFMVDARAGLTSADIGIADYLRKQNKKVFLVANKVDVEGADKNFDRLRERYNDSIVIPVSGDSEFSLRRAEQKGLIKYSPGSEQFEIIKHDELNAKQISALDFIKKGIMGEYIGRIYSEVKGRPLYLVRQSYGLSSTR